ncbi:MAG: ComF family protein, partial [Armatimonadota bacterium]
MRPEFCELLESILELLYPKKCFACERIGYGYICPWCLEDIQPVPEPFCTICGQPEFDGLCPNCRKKTPAFVWARAAGLFDGVLRNAIHKLKYDGHTYLAQDLGLLLVRHLNSAPPQEFDIIVPVPIH